jgi:uncharacterized protein YqeY
MKTYKDLKKEKIECYTTDPIRSSVLGLIIAGADSIAKKDLRATTDQDVVSSVQKLIKQNEESYELMKNDLLLTKINILKEYAPNFPIVMSEEGTRKRIEFIVKEQNIELIKKNQGFIMKVLRPKEQGGIIIDMKIASKILNEILK